MSTYTKFIIPLIFIGILGSGLISCSSETNNDNNSSKTLRHVVFFSFTEETPDDVVDEIGQTLIALEESIEVIESLEWGESIAEGQEYSHCLLVNFNSEEDLDIYGPHPEHQKFIEDYKKYFAKVAVVDYWTSE